MVTISDVEMKLIEFNNLLQEEWSHISVPINFNSNLCKNFQIEYFQMFSFQQSIILTYQPCNQSCNGFDVYKIDKGVLKCSTVKKFN